MLTQNTLKAHKYEDKSQYILTAALAAGGLTYFLPLTVSQQLHLIPKSIYFAS